MKSRVIPYGFGKCFVEIQKEELPTDILELLTKRYEKSGHGIKENTTKIIFVVEDIIGKE